jgi:hypothetical protein
MSMAIFRSGRNYTRIALALTVMPIILVACGGGGKKWSSGAAAPERFAPWVGAPSIKLPTSAEKFERYLSNLHVRGELAPGPGWPVPIPPASFEPKKCNGKHALVFYFDYDSVLGAKPKYVAYMTADGIVSCVQN